MDPPITHCDAFVADVGFRFYRLQPDEVFTSDIQLWCTSRDRN